MSLVNTDKAVEDAARTLGALLAGATLIVGGAGAALADGSTTKFSLPPISQAKDRCMFKSSAMGQANAARDKLYDLRECDLRWDLGGGGGALLVIASVSVLVCLSCLRRCSGNTAVKGLHNIMAQVCATPR